LILDLPKTILIYLKAIFTHSVNAITEIVDKFKKDEKEAAGDLYISAVAI